MPQIKKADSEAALAAAVDAARKAGELVRRRARRLDLLRLTRKKEGMASDADTDAEDLIIRTLAKTHPDSGFLAEESGASGDPEKNTCWVIDPIDGTGNFIRGLPHYCVSIAFCEDGAPQAGVVYDVCRDDLFSARRGGGAYQNDRRIRVREASGISDALLLSSALIGGGARGWPLLRTLQRKSAGVRRGGATALDFVHTAAGGAAALFGANACYWDIAAGLLILREAGGLACELDAEDEFAFGKRTGFFAGGAPKTFAAVIREARAADAR